MGIFKAIITYSHDSDIYVTEIQIDAEDADQADVIARHQFEAQNVFDDIKEVVIEEIPIGI